MAGNTVGEAFVKIRPETSGFEAETQQKVSSSLGGLAGALKAGATLAGVGVAAGLGLAGAAGLKAAADFQTSQVAFEGILGSASKAQAFIGDLKQFAAVTPFELPGLQEAAKQLLGVGFSADQVIPSLTSIGNVAANLGAPAESINGVVRALGQMKGKGKASAEEMNQISEQLPGFSAIGAVAKSMGITTAEAMDKMAAGAIPADAAIKAIIDGMNQFPGAAGAMERQSQTLSGVLSTLKDTTRNALAEGFAPIVPVLAKALNGAMPAISSLMSGIAGGLGTLASTILPVFTNLFNTIGPMIGPLFNTVAKGLAPVLGTIFDTLGRVATQVGPVLGQVFGQLSGTFQKLWASIGPLIPKLAESFASMGTGVITDLLPLAPVLAQIATAGAKVIAAIPPPILAKIAEAFILFAGAKKALGPLNQIAGLASQAITPIKTLQKTLGPLTVGFKALGLAISANPIGAIVAGIVLLVTGLILAYQHFKPFRDIVDAVGRFLAGVFKAALDGVVTAFNAVIDAVGGAFDALSGLGDLVDTVVGFFLGIPDAILSGLGDLGGLLVDVGSSIIQGLIDGITLYLELLYTIWIELPLKILGFFVGAAKWLFDVGTQILTGLLDGIIAYAKILWFFWVQLPLKILGFFVGAAKWLFNIGIDILTGLGNGIIDGAGEVLGWLGGMGERILRGLGNIANVLFDIGKKIMHGLWDGLREIWHDITGWLSDLNPADWKGPPARDRKMLVGAGRLIMAGLSEGLERGWRDTTRLLSSFDVGNEFGGLTAKLNGLDISGASGPVLAGAAGSGGVVIMPGAITQSFAGNVNREDLARSNDELITALTESLRTVA